MEPVKTVTSIACPIDANDVDTDQIIPKQYLKRVERTGYGEFAFAEWRYDADGRPRPEFPMNKPEYAGARIMVSGRNFGCGSSREHAAWALEDAGFRAIIAAGFADIFRTNCTMCGLVTVELDEATVRQILDLVAADPGTEITVDLEAQRVTVPGNGERAGIEATFPVDPYIKDRLLKGLDDIALTMQHIEEIASFEQDRPSWKPLVPVAKAS